MKRFGQLLVRAVGWLLVIAGIYAVGIGPHTGFGSILVGILAGSSAGIAYRIGQSVGRQEGRAAERQRAMGGIAYPIDAPALMDAWAGLPRRRRKLFRGRIERTPEPHEFTRILPPI